MIDIGSFLNARLAGGFVIADIRLSGKRLVDAIGREALAQTTIVGTRFNLVLWAGMDEGERSVTIYHEILEAAAVASALPPASVAEFNEGDFERAAREMHDRFGAATPEKLNQMLRQFGLTE
ncbi:MAG: hypothetical protein HZA91_16710 [Verrucomicrobia bacterium]|nr:hypothetical protein [Verrucomicrobiota bacterium]